MGRCICNRNHLTDQRTAALLIQHRQSILDGIMQAFIFVVVSAGDKAQLLNDFLAGLFRKDRYRKAVLLLNQFPCIVVLVHTDGNDWIFAGHLKNGVDDTPAWTLTIHHSNLIKSIGQVAQNFFFCIHLFFLLSVSFSCLFYISIKPAHRNLSRTHLYFFFLCQTHQLTVAIDANGFRFYWHPPFPANADLPA